MAKRVFGVASDEFSAIVPSGPNGLKPGHEWATPTDSGWVVLLDPNGRAHTVTENVLGTVNDKGVANFVDSHGKRRRVHSPSPDGYLRACRVATFHEKMVQASPPAKKPDWKARVRLAPGHESEIVLFDGPCRVRFSEWFNDMVLYSGGDQLAFSDVQLAAINDRHIVMYAVHGDPFGERAQARIDLDAIPEGGGV